MTKRPWFRYLLALLWMALIFRASATPDLRAVPLAQHLGLLPDLLGPELTGWLELVLRKGAHLFSFGLLALLIRWGLATGFPPLRPPYRDLAAFLVTLLYAVSDEWHQSFVPTRDARVSDVLIDAAGAALALALFRARRSDSGGSASGTGSGSASGFASGSSGG